MGPTSEQVVAALGRLRWAVQAARVSAAARRFHALAEKAHFNPNEPRVPRGSGRESGRWTYIPGWAARLQADDTGSPPEAPRTHRDDGALVLSDVNPTNDWKPGAEYAQARPTRRGGGGGVRVINGQAIELTPGQATRLAMAEMTANAAIARVRERDPGWKPPAQLYEGVEGAIRANDAVARAAGNRLAELAGVGPGPYAGDSIPARGPGRINAKERACIDAIAAETGCHTCGTKLPGTTSGRFVGDHQLPNALNPLGLPQRLFPQCLVCSLRQGGKIHAYSVEKPK